MFIKPCESTYKDKTYESFWIVEGYREDGDVKHRYILNVTKYSPAQREKILKAFNNPDAMVVDEDDDFFDEALDYGNITFFLYLLKRAGITDIFKKRLSKRALCLILAVLINRMIKPASKLEAISWIKDTAFPHFCELTEKEYHVNRVYEAMDEVYENLGTIMEDFYKSDGAEPYVLLYDISSVYFEGERVEIAKRGYSRDKRPDRPQVLLGLVLNKRGHPIHFEVLPGNIKDSQTVLDVIEKLKKRFGIKKGIFIGDRGMITSGNLKDIKEEELGYIMALKHEAAKDLLINEEIQPELFDERIPIEIGGDGEKKYVLCGSKYRKERDLKIFKNLLDKGKEALGIVERMVNAGRLKKYDKVVRRAQKKLTQTNTERYLDFEYKDGEFKIIELKENIERAKNLCGYYILETSELGLEDKEVEKNYKKLQDVERVFRDLKNLLDIRPIYHWKDRRVKTHIYLCLIAQSILGKLRGQLAEIGWLGREKDKTLSNFINQLGTIHLGVFKDEFTDETKYKVQSKNPLKQELKDILGFSFFNFERDKQECCI